jgi:hypothetical protein
MTKIASSFLLAAFLALCLHVVSAQAQLVRTCVSMAKGSDSNSATSCHCTTPCRTFATAHANTLANGEITVLDPGDYGGLTITKSISINNDSGGEASVTVAGNGGNNSVTGIVVNAAADAYVNLRGLTIQGVGFGVTVGLRFNTGLFLTMTNCVVRDHTADGIQFEPLAKGTLSIADTLVTDNGGSGILVQPIGNATVRVSLDHVKVYNNSSQGVLIDGNGSTGTLKAVVKDSVAANQGGAGFSVLSFPGQAPTNLMVIGSLAFNNNGAGVVAGGGAATAQVGQTTLSGNTFSWSAVNGGNLQSFGDNYVVSNADGDPAAPNGAVVRK